jgi:hypothetical protein
VLKLNIVKLSIGFVLQEDEEKVKTAADSLARANSNLVHTQHLSKKRKIEKDLEDMILVPVS